MNDYISREKAKLQLNALAMETARNNVGFTADASTVYEDCAQRVMRWLDMVPKEDVQAVVRGHYIGDYDGYADGAPVYDIWSCSACGCVFEDWDEKPTYNFCPNCGADMREEAVK